MKTGAASVLLSICVHAVAMHPPLRAQTSPGDQQRLEALKTAVAGDVDSRQKLTQVIVDTLFSYGELGFQEIETSRYLVALLRKEGFTVKEGIAGVPTAWMASWGSGKPVIALGSDIDCIPQASQKPGVAYHDPIVEGAPGHGEGHNSGQAVNIVAALAVKRIMEREKIPGTLRLWPGVAEELLATKAYFVREGYFKDVDAVLFAHVNDTLNVSWGATRQTGMVSVEYTFSGHSAHSGASPWRGKSALDAVELMDVGWNFRREHLRLQQRSHYVIPNGGDQPNVVPSVASVWYYFRELDYPHVNELWAIGRDIAKGAALMTGTTFTRARARVGVGAAFQQGTRRGGRREHPDRRPAAVERCRSSAGERPAEGTASAGTRPRDRARAVARPRDGRGARFRVGRYRRRLVERADDRARISLEHP